MLCKILRNDLNFTILPCTKHDLNVLNSDEKVRQIQLIVTFTVIDEINLSTVTEANVSIERIVVDNSIIRDLVHVQCKKKNRDSEA